MVYAFLIFSSIAFIELFIQFNLRGQLGSIMTISREAVNVLISSTMEDDEKEIVIRRSSLVLFKATFAIISRFSCILVIMYTSYIIMVNSVPEIEEHLLKSLYSIRDLILLTVFTICYVLIRNVIRKQL